MRIQMLSTFHKSANVHSKHSKSFLAQPHQGWWIFSSSSSSNVSWKPQMYNQQLPPQQHNKWERIKIHFGTYIYWWARELRVQLIVVVVVVIACDVRVAMPSTYVFRTKRIYLFKKFISHILWSAVSFFSFLPLSLYILFPSISLYLSLFDAYVFYEVKEMYVILFCEWWHWLVDTKAKRSNLLFCWLLFVTKWDSARDSILKWWTLKCQNERTYQFLLFAFMCIAHLIEWNVCVRNRCEHTSSEGTQKSIYDWAL